MKKLLRIKESRAFVAEEGGWTEDLSRAKTFETPEGLKWIDRFPEVGELELYYTFQDDNLPTAWDFAISLQAH